MTVRVLLVDDVADIRRLVRLALRFHGGFEVVGEAAGGADAIEQAASLRPDVVLLDLGLPDLAGREVLTRLRAVAPGTKVVVFTGQDDTDREFYAEHAAGYVRKNVELDYLVGLLHDVGRVAELVAIQEFDADVRCVPLAREFVRRQLSEWSAERFEEDATLIVTELGSNAVLHAHSAFVVRLKLAEGCLRVEVVDDDPGTPEPQPLSATAEDGRGLLLVSAVASSWGIQAGIGHGKVTWAELNAPGSR